MTEQSNSKSIIIIGAGIAGLSTGVYAQMNGFNSRIYEMHTLPGGLMTAWKRKGYTIDGCIHWLTGSSPLYADHYQRWLDVGLIQDRELFNPEVFLRVENAEGKVFNLYTDVDKLEKHMLELAPEDGKVIRSLCSTIRKLAEFGVKRKKKWYSKLIAPFQMMVMMPMFVSQGKMTLQQFADKFTNPFLHEVFSKLWYPEMSAIGLPFTLGMLSNQGAGYTMGGSLPMAQAVEKRYLSLGGDIQYEARVKRILVEGDRAVGIELENGQIERADYVISAADGYNTIFKMLDGKYINDEIKTMYSGQQPIFEPIVFVGLGVKQTFDELPGCTGGIGYLLKEPIRVGEDSVDHLDAMVYNFDPSLAPQGKTAITVMLPTHYQYWKDLYADGANREEYDAEKQRIALEVIDRLDEFLPGIKGKVEMADVATPLTFEHYTGNWQGSFEGWLPTPSAMMKPISKTLPGLSHFYMAGQWVQAGGGLPSGVMTGQQVIGAIAKAESAK
jgi:phytoene dehydrogenase-like protein